MVITIPGVQLPPFGQPIIFTTVGDSYTVKLGNDSAENYNLTTGNALVLRSGVNGRSYTFAYIINAENLTISELLLEVQLLIEDGHIELEVSESKAAKVTVVA